MSETKWTSGPWTMDEPSGMQKPRIYGCGGQVLIAEVGNAETDLASLNRHEADARMMTASLELYEACGHAEAVMSIVAPRSHTAEYLEVLGKIRAAMARARGDQPANPGEGR